MQAQERIGDMSLKELEGVIERILDARLQAARSGQATPEVWQQILDSLIKPSAAQPTPTELLRQERDQWYHSS
jgi:hypothetical protein